MMRDPAYLETFLTTIKKGIRLPLTVKMRTGWNENELTIHECVQAAYQSGCEWVAIHGRTRAQGYEGKADWNLIAEVKSRAKLPIIGNGDIRNAEQAKQRLYETGVDAVMIGRGALRNPWIFKECAGVDAPRLGHPTSQPLLEWVARKLRYPVHSYFVAKIFFLAGVRLSWCGEVPQKHV